ncbi:MAG: carbonic anhydrase family protein [Rhodocyclaceae bacterium]|nr:carbonic anhydrase family protein [Rhodocyclaceae bacterium]
MSLLAVTLLLTAGPALAAPGEWQAVAGSAGSMIEIDRGRITKSAGKTAAWTRLTLDHPVLDFENQIRYSVVEALNHYDCAKNTFTTQQRVFLLDNRTMKTEKVADKRQITARPDSFDARLMDAVCKPRAAAEMQQAAAKDAAPRVMHAEMVKDGEVSTARSMQVADKPRLFEVPIDKSKAEDPHKGASPAPAPAAKPAASQSYSPPPARVAQAAPAPRSATPPPPRPADPPPAQELSRQQRELQLATSGPRKAAPRKPAAEAVPPAPSFEGVRWGYAGPGAPENWAKLHPHYIVCGTGKRQSPIDIRGGIKVDLDPIRFDYRNTLFRITDNGHTVQVDVAEGNAITVTGRSYQLQHLQFHRPSEVRINGKPFDMAVHLVHKDYDNNLAIIAVLLEKGAEHPVIQTLWNHLPLEVGMEVAPPSAAIDLAKLLPAGREYYTYMGSLTTPPCTENVTWMVFKEAVQISPEQSSIFARLYPNNARPVQPAHDRLIKESR